MKTHAHDLTSEQRHEIERQHREIIELNNRVTYTLALATTLEIEKDNLASEAAEANTARDDAERYASRLSRELDQQHQKIQDSVNTLSVLDEVPLGHLKESIDTIIDRLTA